MAFNLLKKFSTSYIIYRFHQLFYFKQIIIRDGFKFIIDKKLIPLYNLKGIITRYKNHEKDERLLIKKYLKQYNTLELGCSIGILSLYIKKIIKNKKLISIDGNNKAIEYSRKIFKINSIDNYDLINHKIGGDGFTVDQNNFLSSRNNKKKYEFQKSKKLLNSIIKKNNIKNLIIDIEGMEEHIFDFLELGEILFIFIEFHPDLYLRSTKKQIILKIESFNFSILSRVNENYCFYKNI